MKKLYSVVFLMLALSKANAQIPKEKTLLWEVTGKGITSPSYLFGTIHIMCPDQIKVPKVVLEKFDKANTLYLEIDMSDPKLMTNMMERMKMKDASTLHSLLGESFDSLNKQFTAVTGFSLELLNTTKPILSLSSLYPSLLGCNPGSWETTFAGMAKKENKKVEGLETVDYQLGIFDTIPYAVQADILSKIIANQDSSRKELARMIEIYNKKDVNLLNELTVSDDGLKAFEAVLLTNRNNQWISTITQVAKKQSTFFAFGAGHLGGKSGIIYLLRKKGYTVKPVLY